MTDRELDLADDWLNKVIPHRHREIRFRPDDVLLRWLRKPLWHSRNLPRVDKSPYPYGPCTRTDHSTCYYLSVLSVLHRWTGFTVNVVPYENGSR